MSRKIVHFCYIALIVIIYLLANVACFSQEQTSKTEPTSFSLTKSPQLFPPLSTFQIALGDLDDDGDLDAVFANMGAAHSQLWLNDGQGHFTDSGQKFTQQGHGVDLGDLDGDGDLDFFISCASLDIDGQETYRPSRVYLNDGQAVFYDTGQELGKNNLSGNGVELLDIDGDGDLDAAVFYYERPNKIFLNNGQGIFTDSKLSFPDESAWGDLDLDGDADIFVRQQGAGYKTMLNDGQGNLTNHWSFQDKAVIRGFLGLGDIDNDGDLDAVATNGNRTESFPTKVFINDGRGKFTDSEQNLRAVKAGRVGLADLNGDGYIDVLITSYQQPNEVWLNDRSGHFYDRSLRLEDKDAFHGVSFGDLDNDGDLDIFLANYIGGANEIWLNESSP